MDKNTCMRTESHGAESAGINWPLDEKQEGFLEGKLVGVVPKGGYELIYSQNLQIC